MRKKRKRRFITAVMLAGILVISHAAQAFATMDLTLGDTGSNETPEENILDCKLEIHAHTSGCYDQEEKLTCGYADYVVHTHDTNCYDRSGALACKLPEVKEHTHESSCYQQVTNHTHGESCYQTENLLTCGQEENAGHTHGEDCYQTSPICGQDENAGHTHGDGCYQTMTSLNCGQEESADHAHSESCYQTESLLACGQEESAGHTHSESCYQTSLICGQEENVGHTHGEGCYTAERKLTCQEAETGKVLTCTKKEAILHTHTASCYDANKARICGKVETNKHQHKAECFKTVVTVEEASANGESVQTAEGGQESGESEESEESDPDSSKPTETENVESAETLESETTETVEPEDADAVESEETVEPENAEVLEPEELEAVELKDAELVEMEACEEEELMETEEADLEALESEPEEESVSLETLDPSILQNLSSAIRSAVQQDNDFWNQVMMAPYEEETCLELCEQFGVEPEIMQLYLAYMGESFTALYDAIDEETLTWEQLNAAANDENQQKELAERFGIDTETLLLFLQYNADQMGTSVASVSVTSDHYTINGEIAFSLNPNKTKKESEGATYTLRLTSPGNGYTADTYCSKALYVDGYNKTYYTPGCVLWCVNSYNSEYANLGVRYGISEESKWEGLRKAVQYAVWYYSSTYSVPKNSSDPVMKLAYDIKEAAWEASGDTSGGGNIYWYESNDSSAPNLVSFTYSGNSATGYTGSRGEYETETGTIDNAITLSNNGMTQLGFCYDPDGSNPKGDTYYYSGIISNYTIRKILYNGYPVNKELLNQTGMTTDKLWYQTQRAVWNKINGETYPYKPNELYRLLIGEISSFTMNGVTVTMQEPPDDFIVYCYTASGRQRIIIPEAPMLTSISGTKTWVGDEANTSARPSEITLQLWKRVGDRESLVVRNGFTGTFTVTAENNWTYNFSSMPRYDKGEEVTYFIKEINVPDGYTSSINGFNVTNTYDTPEDFNLTVQKKVVTEENSTTNAPADASFRFTVTLKKGDAYYNEPVSYTIDGTNTTVTPENGTVEFSIKANETMTMKLPAGISYDVDEPEGTLPNGFIQVSSENNSGTSTAGGSATAVITNQYSTVTLEGTKTWVNDYESVRPKSLTLELWKEVNADTESIAAWDGFDGTFTVSAENNWTYQFTDLPKYEKGVEVRYYVKEPEVPQGYTSTENGMNVTNTYENGKVSLILTKYVQGRYADLDRSFTFQIHLTDPDGKALTGTYKVDASSTVEGVTAPDIQEITFNENGIASVSLKHGQRIQINDLPKGYGYEITELEVDNEDKFYTAEIQIPAQSSKSTEGLLINKKIVSNQNITWTEQIEYTNTRDDISQTGIRTDLVPLAVFGILAVLIAGMVSLFYAMRRRNRA